MMSEQPDGSELRGRMGWQLIVLLGALTAVGPLTVDMYLPSFPQITEQLALAQGAVELTLAAFLLAMGVCQLFYGPLADRFGRRKPLLVGCGIFVVGSLGCMMARSLEMLVAARVVQGLGGAAGVVIARATVRDCFEEREAARIFSQLMLVMGVAPILAPWLGVEVLSISSWRGIFVVLAFFGSLCGMVAFRMLPETLPVERRVKGGVGMALRNFGLLLRDWQFVAYMICGGCASGVLFAYIAGSPFVLMELHGLDLKRYGLFFGLNALGLIAATQLNRALLRRWESLAILRVATAGMALFATGLPLLVLTGRDSFAPLFSLLFLSLFCVGLVFPNYAAVALAPHGEHAGSASALMGAVQFLIGATAGAAVGFFHEGTALSMTGVMAASGVIGAVSLVGAWAYTNSSGRWYYPRG